MDNRNASNDDAGPDDSLNNVIRFDDIVRHKIDQLTAKADVHRHLATESVSLQAKAFHRLQNEVLSVEIGNLKAKLRHLKNQGFTPIYRDIFSIEPFTK